MAGCAFHPAQRSGDSMSFWPEKLTGRFGRKMEAEISAYVRTKSDGAFPYRLFFSSVHLKVALDTVALTTHPSEFLDMHIFQELTSSALPFMCSPAFPLFRTGRRNLRGAAGFYFIDQPVQLQMAAASIFSCGCSTWPCPDRSVVIANFQEELFIKYSSILDVLWIFD